MTSTKLIFSTGTRDRVFVRVPGQPGKWARAPISVIKVACPFCGAAIGELCISRDTPRKYWCSSVHYVRNNAARKIKPHIILKGNV